jgi:hypothetical protein
MSDSGKPGRVRLALGNKVTADDGTKGTITGVFRSPRPGDTDVRVQGADGKDTDHKSGNLRNRD